MVGQTGIVWNRVQPWLMEVEQLRQQVGMAGANALNSGEFSRFVAVPWGMGTVCQGRLVSGKPGHLSEIKVRIAIINSPALDASPIRHPTNVSATH